MAATSALGLTATPIRARFPFTPPPTVPPQIVYASSPVAATELVPMGNVDPTLASGDTATFYAITTGTKPDWLSFSSANGRFSGTPELGSTSPVILVITPSNGAGAGLEATLEIDVTHVVPPTPPPPATIPAPAVIVVGTTPQLRPNWTEL